MPALNLELIIEADDLEALLGSPELLLVDVSQAQTYQQFHVPGAVQVTPAELISGIPPATGKLPSLEQLTELFSRIGYSPDRHIVVYDDEGGGWAGRFIWILDVIGHKHYSYLNGGIHVWMREGHPVSAEPAQVHESEVNLSIDHTPIATLEQVKDSIENAHIKIWDARSSDEYAGSKVTAQRNGHIPGAINLDWLQTIDRENNFRIFPLDFVEEKLHMLGINPGDKIITHCHTHHRSGLTYLIAKALKYPVKAYDGSWSEWGNLPDTPIERS
jgi:thiosulfate/3-mercaptopyruvate sulfurtransferase